MVGNGTEQHSEKAHGEKAVTQEETSEEIPKAGPDGADKTVCLAGDSLGGAWRRVGRGAVDLALRCYQPADDALHA